MRKDKIIILDEKDIQVSGYPEVSLFISPDTSPYYNFINYDLNTNDTNDDIIFNDILKKYSGAWEKLAEL